ncbi:unnamed protein product [Ceutorhynchus assimilis]|uniref:Uncharacterized protein n=1 Tax=Ceutorhynchus assimilis TaxID=467358 RepID=A0A9N9MNT9_9CUCU|nr:unnamed protein product [Ceutorhynchus assimilis]
MNPTITYSNDDDYIDLREEIDLLKLKNRTRKKEPILKSSKPNNYNDNMYRNGLGSSYSRIYGNQMFQDLAHPKSPTEYEISFPDSRQNFRRDVDNIDRNYISQSLRNAFAKTKEEMNRKKASMTENVPSTVWKDPRLKEKYSVLKLPWTRRSHTLPIDKSKISLKSKENYIKKIEYTDNYRYDDGSDSDSTSIVECKISSSLNIVKKAIESSLFIFYNCGTYIIAFVIVFLFLWCVTNQNFLLNKLFQPKPPESQLTRLFKYFGGMIMYSFNAALRVTRHVFRLSTKVVYSQTPTTETWPPRIYY